ncbi:MULTISPECIES: FkbM family methyltransferase [unclassified Thermosynechococcus]|uniref:FkbM family methyltransferase n=1 Tax=unclassified Thermosynechococcus TaxID=2622553 RepID=UPI00287724FF|nr:MULTISPECIES: FkbM family methyltransferase [unclassified Thermosynechococcus]WNC52874.1 FkbM family methyltransferase [Thermosynechococcus sp. TG215]WNC57965.1 FkbM family methyltransferase [Thermosynechococcus sp. TG218]
MANLKYFIKTIFRKFGYDLVRYRSGSHPVALLARLLEFYQIDNIIDVGANTGQFVSFLRDQVGYSGKVNSFEPLSSAFKILEIKARNDQLWTVYNYGLGDFTGEAEINISENSYSSSLLNMMQAHLDAAPNSKYISKENITIKTLDSIFSNIASSQDKIFMKIDTQGFESKVLKGAENSLKKILLIQLEMSLVSLYEGEILFEDMLGLMKGYGYRLVGLVPGFADLSTGHLLQVDGIFSREPSP